MEILVRTLFKEISAIQHTIKTMARKGIFAFNPARKQLFSVNLARWLEKLPTPALELYCYHLIEKIMVITTLEKLGNIFSKKYREILEFTFFFA